MTDRHIHTSAVVEEGAKLGKDVSVGPFCYVGPEVVLGNGVELKSHACIWGNTKIGDRSRVFPFASIGHEPQDLKYRGEPNELIVGADCLIREGVTINPGTAGDISKTVIGEGCVFLANSHVAHDCVLGDRVIFSNNVMLAGHCKVGNDVIVGGGSGIHQFCRIGDNAFIGGLAGVENDVIPFGMALGNRAYLGGLNVIGMKRAGLARENIHNARNAFRLIFSSGKPLAQAVAELPTELRADPVVTKIVAFVENSGDRALCTLRNGRDS